jgi:hypothetical protein
VAVLDMPGLEQLIGPDVFSRAAAPRGASFAAGGCSGRLRP